MYRSLVVVLLLSLFLSGCGDSPSPASGNTSSGSSVSVPLGDLDITEIYQIQQGFGGLTQLQKDQYLESLRGARGYTYGLVGQVNSDGSIKGTISDHLPSRTCVTRDGVGVTITGISLEEAVRINNCDVLRLEGTLDFKKEYNLNRVYLRDAKILEVNPTP